MAWLRGEPGLCGDTQVSPGTPWGRSWALGSAKLDLTFVPTSMAWVTWGLSHPSLRLSSSDAGQPLADLLLQVTAG